MARYVLDVPESDIREAADILAGVLLEYPEIQSCGVLKPDGNGYFVRKTKTGASIVNTFGRPSND
jgi:hypothetical protein